MTRARVQRHEFLKPEEYEAWNGLLILTRTTLDRLDEALGAEAGVSVTEFDVLITLYNAPQRRLGMSALAAQVMLSPSGLTHLVTRMERDGLLERIGDPTDRRKFSAVLTDLGDRRLRTARRTHNAVLQDVLFRNLDAVDRRTLAKVGGRLKRSSEHG